MSKKVREARVHDVKAAYSFGPAGYVGEIDKQILEEGPTQLRHQALPAYLLGGLSLKPPARPPRIHPQTLASLVRDVRSGHRG
jgi:hypothetical protein